MSWTLYRSFTMEKPSESNPDPSDNNADGIGDDGMGD